MGDPLAIAAWYDNNPVVQGIAAAAYERGLAAGRRQAADDIRATHDTWSQLGKLPQSYLDGVADAAGIVDRAPTEPVEDGADAHTS